MPLFDALRYGAIGLGAILAVLAYRLLRREQDQESARREVIVAIYVYMFFSLILVAGGLFLELWRDENQYARHARDLERQVAELKKQDRPKDSSSAQSGTLNPGEDTSVSPELSAVNVSGQWDVTAVAVAAVDSSGRRFDDNHSGTFRIELRQEGSNIRGHFVWATGSACTRADIAGKRHGDRLDLQTIYTGNCCSGAIERMLFRLVSNDRMEVEMQPDGIPPLPDCTLVWGRGSAKRANE